MYTYNAIVKRVVDGDTVDLEVDLGFKLYTIQRFRLNGIDAPETRSKNLEEKEVGLRAKKYLTDRIIGKEVKIQTTKQGKFGRYLIELYLADKNINKELLEKGYVKAYSGEKKAPFNKEDYKA